MQLLHAGGVPATDLGSVQADLEPEIFFLLFLPPLLFLDGWRIPS
jgi:NhaP-type Na+/H+ or K+/H+ antiporter